MTKGHEVGAALIGGGGHALVVADAAMATGVPLRGFYDDAADAAALRLGLARLGGLREAVGGPWHLAVGDARLRRELLGGLAGEPLSIVHPAAFVGATARHGRGVFIGPRAVVHTLARIGDHAIINTAAVVEHECEIGENVHVAPGAVLGGRVRVGPDTLLGIGCRVLPGLRIGAGCTIGAGAAVVRDVADGATVAGVPARAL